MLKSGPPDCKRDDLLRMIHLAFHLISIRDEVYEFLINKCCEMQLLLDWGMDFDCIEKILRNNYHRIQMHITWAG